jgi:hypothetical protein
MVKILQRQAARKFIFYAGLFLIMTFSMSMISANAIHRVHGHGSYFDRYGLNAFSLDAAISANGSISGTLEWTLYQDSGSETVNVALNCMTVLGSNTAVSGMVVSASDRALIGQSMGFMIVDHDAHSRLTTDQIAPGYFTNCEQVRTIFGSNLMRGDFYLS